MKLRKYESIYVTKPDLTETEEKKIFERIVSLIENKGGKILRVDDWGVRKTAYPIKKYTKAHYLQLVYVGPPGIVADLDRIFRILDGVIRFYSMKTADEVPAEYLERDNFIYTNVEGAERFIPYDKLLSLKLKADTEIRFSESTRPAPESNAAPAKQQKAESTEENKEEQPQQESAEEKQDNSASAEGGE